MYSPYSVVVVFKFVPDVVLEDVFEFILEVVL